MEINAISRMDGFLDFSNGKNFARSNSMDEVDQPIFSSLEAALHDLQKAIAENSPDDVFYMDETGN